MTITSSASAAGDQPGPDDVSVRAIASSTTAASPRRCSAITEPMENGARRGALLRSVTPTAATSASRAAISQPA